MAKKPYRYKGQRISILVSELWMEFLPEGNEAIKINQFDVNMGPASARVPSPLCVD